MCRSLSSQTILPLRYYQIPRWKEDGTVFSSDWLACGFFLILFYYETSSTTMYAHRYTYQLWFNKFLCAQCTSMGTGTQQVPDLNAWFAESKPHTCCGRESCRNEWSQLLPLFPGWRFLPQPHWRTTTLAPLEPSQWSPILHGLGSTGLQGKLSDHRTLLYLVGLRARNQGN